MSITAMKHPWIAHYDHGVRPHLEYPDLSLQALLDDTAARFPDQPASLFYGRPMSYRELAAGADAFAAGLHGLGVKPGDRVALMLPNIPQALVAFFGILKAGAIVVWTNPLYVEREIAHQMTDAGAETIVALDILYPRLQKALPGTPTGRIILTSVGEALPFPLNLLYPIKARKEGQHPGIPRAENVWSYQAMLKRHRGQRAPVHPVRPESDLAVLQYTGGTTGISKGAMLTHRNLVSNIWQMREWLQPGPPGTERLLAVMPFFHVYGLTVCLGVGVAIGGSLILVPRFDIKQVLDLINRHKPTIFPGVPTMYVAIINHPDLHRYDLKSIRSCISAAAPLPVEVQTRFEELTGGKLVEAYGLTEASPATHCNPLYGKRVIGSIGLPFPDTEMKVVDLESGDTELPTGEPGELCIRGPQVMQGYWNRPEESAQTLRDGYLYTGDIARVDEDGFTYIVDRKKELIISGGYNIYPREVEEVLFAHPAVQEAAVVGVPDPYRGEAVRACVVLKGGHSATAEEIIAFCQERLARYKVPKTVEFRDSLPKSLIGKVLRRVLREEASGG